VIAAFRPGEGASHTVHFSVAVEGFEHMHVSQVHPGCAFGVNPDAAQSNVFGNEGGADALDAGVVGAAVGGAGRSAWQIVHLVVSEAEFF